MSSEPSLDPTRRFSSRVGNYSKYRPGYPAAILDLLRAECQLTSDSVVADIGSGTGILTALLLKNGNPVFAVEPNREMREAAERLLDFEPGFVSVPATAEATTLPAGKLDFITVAQAFHWFNVEPARLEFLRILKPSGWIALIWNDRHVGEDGFLSAYENLLLIFADGYSPSRSHYADVANVQRFFGTVKFKQATFPNWQTLDFEGLKGRLLSSSYAPEPGHPKHDPMMDELRAVFAAHQSNGSVTFKYDTMVFYGQPAV